MNGKRIMIAGAVMLAVGVIVLGIIGNLLFGEQRGGAADALHFAQLALLGVGLVTLVVGVVTHFATGRRSAA